jgi:hypothetical protein
LKHNRFGMREYIKVYGDHQSRSKLPSGAHAVNNNRKALSPADSYVEAIGVE